MARHETQPHDTCQSYVALALRFWLAFVSRLSSTPRDSRPWLLFHILLSLSLSDSRFFFQCFICYFLFLSLFARLCPLQLGAICSFLSLLIKNRLIRCRLESPKEGWPTEHCTDTFCAASNTQQQPAEDTPKTAVYTPTTTSTATTVPQLLPPTTADVAATTADQLMTLRLQPETTAESSRHSRREVTRTHRPGGETAKKASRSSQWHCRALGG